MATYTTVNTKSCYMEGYVYPGPITGHTMPDGSIVYNGYYTPIYNDITVDGNSVRDWIPEEARIWPDGHGYVLVERLNSTAGITTYSSGFPLNYTLNGQIAIM